MVNGITPDPIGASKLQKVAEELATRSSDKPQGLTDGAPSFGDMLTKMIEEVDDKQKIADESIKQLTTGEETSIQDVVMKLEEADMTFKLMKEIRDKLVAAYKEVMSMSSQRGGVQDRSFMISCLWHILLDQTRIVPYKVIFWSRHD